MMQTTAALAELFFGRDCSGMRDRKDYESRSRERGEAELERLRTRERLEATLAGLAELDYLKQRQELLVRNALIYRETVGAGEEDNQVCSAGEESYLNHEEKLLEENILLLRKQLNCLRRRDAGLISQLQELDRQISDLRLDTESSLEHLESDSRPSSGFYELSDGTSGSLSNSSNSVFSECLSSCRSTSCLCAPLDTSLCTSEGRLKSADELGVCTECEEQCEDSTSGTVRRSLSAPYSPSLDGAYDSLSKYQCDLIARNGNDVYHYPSPLHAVAVQSPIFLQSTASNFREDMGPSKSGEAFGESQKTEQHLAYENTSWPAQTSLNKKLDSYIFGLLQRRAQPMRTNKPRTSINTDPSKSVLRQGSLCVRPSIAVQNQQWTHELTSNWQTCVHTASASSTDTSKVSPRRATETKGEPLENEAPCSQNQPQSGYLIKNEIDSNSLLKKKMSGTSKGLPLPVATKECQDLGSANAVSSPKLNKHSCYPSIQDSKSSQVVKAGTSKKSSKIQNSVVCSARQEQSAAELLSLGSSSQSQDEGGLMVSAQYNSNQKQSFKLCKGGNKNAKNVKVKNVCSTKHRTHSNELVSEASRDRHRTASRRSRPVEDMVHSYKPSKRTSCKAKRIPASIPEERILEKHTTSTGRSSTHKHHGHHRHPEAVLAKPKYKRNDYHRRLRGIPEVPYEESLKRVHRRHKREMMGHVPAMYLPSNAHMTSPYAYVGSDSEYSAECASVFHSTILDTSEDERSNYTTNCFGDSESSASEADFVAESSSSSDSEGSSGVNWPQYRQTSRDATSAQAKAFVKIRASHNLKKKILRFRSGSLKLMTTV
ncbi:dapper homolog 1 [Trichomycterus rosablanca]|uniref:dapper homolog 1 n=1 Tax=Trichomycterus rosablanca TaxID=2290929 RepID=UPI002F34F959